MMTMMMMLWLIRKRIGTVVVPLSRIDLRESLSIPINHLNPIADIREVEIRLTESIKNVAKTSSPNLRPMHLFQLSRIIVLLLNGSLFFYLIPSQAFPDQ